MQQQVIVNILGADKLGLLSIISACVSNGLCNVLDSRHAIYGSDFSLSMIVEGSTSDITKLEVQLSALCAQHDLLSMMKRTSGHSKQNLEQLINLEFSGPDATGIISKISEFLTKQHVSVSALRQKTFIAPSTETSKRCIEEPLTAISELGSDSNDTRREDTTGNDSGQHIKCKMVLSASREIDLQAFDRQIKALMCKLGLSGKVTHNEIKEENEHIESW
jgi:glycine cleavage system transcriptional repressor